MDHLNLFLPFENKKDSHEDVLTRNFLFMLKAVPAARKMFADIIHAKVRGVADFDKLPEKFEIKEAYTQVDSGNNMFARVGDSVILSALISDDVLDSKCRVEYSDRHARYDGVLVCDPNLWIIIENKPSVRNVWEGQLNLNLQGNGRNENLIRMPCCLSWRDVVSGFNRLIVQGNLNELEKMLVDDFLMYINEKYIWLNPFDRLDLCKDDPSLVDKRCCSVLKEIGVGEIKYHRGWGYYLSCRNLMIKMIALRCDNDCDSWVTRLKMHFGVTQSASQRLYANIDVERLERLLSEDRQMTATGVFHYAVQSDNVFFPESSSQANALEYVRYWKGQAEQGRVHQIKRASFEAYHQKLIDDGIVSAISTVGFQREIMGKQYQKLNVCPELQICCTWSRDDAISLDKNDRFVEVVSEKIQSIMSIFNADRDIGIDSDEASQLHVSGLQGVIN